MEAKLKTALQTTIDDFYALDQEIRAVGTATNRGMQLLAAKEAVRKVLQNFANAEYVECVNGQWRIKVIVVESASSIRGKF